MSLPSLSEVSNEALHHQLKMLRGKENEVLAELLLHLHEVDLRGIYRDAGYSSLFTYCRECLGYSEGSTHRRVNAARCLGRSPEVYELVREGKVTLCALAAISPVMDEENVGEVLSLAQGASKKEAERIAVRYGAPEKPKRESIKVKSIAPEVDLFSLPEVQSAEPVQPTERFVFTFEVSKDVHDLLEEARTLVGPLPVADLFEKVLKEYVGKRRRTPTRKPRTSPVKLVKPVKAVKSRFVPIAVKREVAKRDGERCTYVSAEGKRCSEKRCLQFDHVEPYAFGGPNSAENLRLLCPAHNRLHAERCFGRERILEYSAARG